MGEIFKSTVEATGKTFKVEEQLGTNMEKWHSEYVLKNEQELRGQKLCVGLYICGYAGYGKSTPGRSKKAQMPKQMMHWRICKSFIEVGWTNSCWKEVL